MLQSFKRVNESRVVGLLASADDDRRVADKECATGLALEADRVVDVPVRKSLETFDCRI